MSLSPETLSTEAQEMCGPCAHFRHMRCELFSVVEQNRRAGIRAECTSALIQTGGRAVKGTRVKTGEIWFSIDEQNHLILD